MTSTSTANARKVSHAARDMTESDHTNGLENNSSSSPASKRKHSSPPPDSNHQSEEANGKKKRRKVNHACVYCRRSHMTCDLQRPCARCVKRDIGHLCHDEPREQPKRGKSDVGVADLAPAPDANDNESAAFTGGQGSDVSLGVVDGTAGARGPTLVQPRPVSPTQLPGSLQSGTTSNFLNNFDWNNSGVHNQFQDMHHLHPNYMFNTSEVTNEYNMLNDFLSTSLLDDGAMYSNDDAQALFSDPLLATSSVNALQNSRQQPLTQSPNTLSTTQQSTTLQPPLLSKIGEEISRPNSAFRSSEANRDKFYLTAADPAGMSSAEDRLHKLLKAKYDAGMLKPFNHVKGYARLNTYMSKHISRESQIRILKQLDRFRPKFREAMQSLTDMQLVLVEMWFERSLMEYDRVFASMAIPACCWRRTGQIFRGNREMAELIGVPWEKLRDGRLAIHDVLAEDSLVSYWEKFGAIAFDQSQKAILTSCSLKHPRLEEIEEGTGTASRDGAGGGGAGQGDLGKLGDKKSGGTGGKEQITKCCFSFTIRRDTHNIPSLIVGNFLPIREHT